MSFANSKSLNQELFSCPVSSHSSYRLGFSLEWIHCKKIGMDLSVSFSLILSVSIVKCLKEEWIEFM